MTRSLPEPAPDGNHKKGEQRLQDAAGDLRAWASLHRYSGHAYIRVDFNQGGVTSARPFIEEPLTPKT